MRKKEAERELKVAKAAAKKAAKAKRQKQKKEKKEKEKKKEEDKKGGLCFLLYFYIPFCPSPSDQVPKKVVKEEVKEEPTKAQLFRLLGVASTFSFPSPFPFSLQGPPAVQAEKEP